MMSTLSTPGAPYESDDLLDMFMPESLRGSSSTENFEMQQKLKAAEAKIWLLENRLRESESENLTLNLEMAKRVGKGYYQKSIKGKTIVGIDADEV